MTARDVFLCHAHSDKKKYARPLSESLAQHAVSVWLDEAEIEVGDSIFDAVSAGLRLARYVAVLVTESFLSQGWTKQELKAAFRREVASNDVVVLPILDIDPGRWLDEFPLFSDKLYFNWDQGVEEISKSIARRFERRPGADWVHEHPQNYQGPVWIRCTPSANELNQSTLLTLRWGPYIRRVEIPAGQGHPVSLIHHKIEADQVPLHVNCEPPAIITYGHGPCPDAMPYCTNIDEGWTRSMGAILLPLSFPSSGAMPKERDLLADQLDAHGSADS